MKRSLPLFSILILWALTPLAQAENLPSVMKSAQDAGVYRPQIQAFLNRQVSALTSADSPDAVKTARATIIGQVTVTPPPSASFLDVYAAELNNALLNLSKADQGKPERAWAKITVRLNAAIVAAEVAKRAGNSQLAPVTDLLMNDDCEAVALWGLKAAKFIVPVQLGTLRQLRKNDLLPLVIGVVKKHADSAAIIEEAYRTVTLETAINLNGLPPETIQEVIPTVQQLLAFRVTLYDADAPAFPAADNEPVLFLTRIKVWKIQSPQQQNKTMWSMYDLVAAMGKLMVVNPPLPDREELLYQFHQVGRAFQVISDYNQNPTLRKAATDIAEISTSAPDTDFTQRLDALNSTIKTIAGPPSTGATAVGGAPTIENAAR